MNLDSTILVSTFLLVTLLYSEGSCCGGSAKGGTGTKKPPVPTTLAPQATPNPTPVPKVTPQPDREVENPENSRKTDLSEPAEKSRSPDRDSVFENVEEPSDLDCSASDKKCCWENEVTADTLDYSEGIKIKSEVLASLKAKQRKQIPKSYINGKQHFFYIGMEEWQSTGVEQTAWFKSCPIPCVDVGAKVSLRLLAKTGTVYLEACYLEDGTQGPLLDCNYFSNKPNRKGRITAKLQNFGTVTGKQVVIRANGFLSNDLLMFDDIQVKYKTETCPDPVVSTTYLPQYDEDDYPTFAELPTRKPSVAAGSTKGKTGNGGDLATPNPSTVAASDDRACAALLCGQVQECTSYSRKSEYGGKARPQQDWRTHSPSDADRETAVIHNIATGVPDYGEQYYGVYLYSQSASVVASGDFDLAQDRIITFERLERTIGIALKLCLDSQGYKCLWSTDSSSSVYSNWKDERVRLPEGTEQIFWVADNSGRNQGAVAFRNVQLHAPSDLNDRKSLELGKLVCR